MVVAPAASRRYPCFCQTAFFFAGRLPGELFFAHPVDHPRVGTAREYFRGRIPPRRLRVEGPWHAGESRDAELADGAIGYSPISSIR